MKNTKLNQQYGTLTINSTKNIEIPLVISSTVSGVAGNRNSTGSTSSGSQASSGFESAKVDIFFNFINSNFYFNLIIFYMLKKIFLQFFFN